MWVVMIGFFIKFSYVKFVNVLFNFKKEYFCLKIKVKCFLYFYCFMYVCVQFDGNFIVLKDVFIDRLYYLFLKYVC